MKYIFLIWQKNKTVFFIYGLVVLFLFFVAIINSQYQNHLDNMDSSVLELESNISMAWKNKDSSLQSASILLEKSNAQATENILSSLVDDSNVIGLKAIGKAVKLNEKELEQYIFLKHKLGFESFAIKDLYGNYYSKEWDIEDFVIVDAIYPYSPHYQRYLGRNLGMARNFKIKQHAIKSDKHSQVLLVDDEDLPQLLIFWSSQHKLLNGEEYLSSNYYFYIIDVATEIESFVNQMSLIKPVYVSLFHRNEKSLLKLDANNESPLLEFEYVVKLHFFTDNSTLSIHFSLYSDDFDLVSAFIWSVIATLFAVALLTVLFVYFRYNNQLKEQENRLNELLINAHEAIIITSEKGVVKNWNITAEKIFGYKQHEIVGRNIQDSIFNGIQGANRTLFGDFNKITLSEKNIVNFHGKDGNSLIVSEVVVSKLQLEDQQEFVFFIDDISEHAKSEKKIRTLAYYDHLTSLENRTYFHQQVTVLMNNKQQINSALLFLDLDGFKKVNDSLGHSVGDELLKIVALRFKNSIHKNSSNTHLCRFGGDEFVFFLQNVSPEDAVKICLRILEQVRMPISLTDHDIQMSACIGLAFSPDHGLDLDTLLRHADTAMYQAKSIGSNTYKIYQDEMEEQLSHRLLIERCLRTAIQNSEFELNYQPQVDIHTNKVIGVEALLRWDSSEIGRVPPNEFIPIAEDSGQIVEIGNWVAKQAIKQLQLWKTSDFSKIRLAINVSSQQIESSDFIDKVGEWLSVNDISADLLELELTERTVMTNSDENISTFNKIKNQGLSLSIDDFGTGYSSLSYLKKFPINILKIDKSFIDGLPDDEDDVSITSTIINLAHSLQMKVVAEGVESENQLEILLMQGCDMVQGYYYSKPLPITEFEAWFQQYSSE